MLLFDEKDGVGTATLARENALNSLNLEMVTGLLAKLKEWARAPHVKQVFLAGAGPKAFCAGGDVKTVCQRFHDANDYAYGESFFRTEYELDLLIHDFPKPLTVFGHGIVMGGGIGLLAGARTRVLTDTSMLAMPEISIGLFPDVGGSYFLSRMPGKAGLFLALTGARMNASDALYCGLGNAFVPNAKLDECKAWLSAGRDLREFEAACGAELPKGQLEPRMKRINETLEGDDPLMLCRRLAALAHDSDEWLAKAASTFVKGSPTSALIIIEQLKRGKTMSLKDCFAMELNMAVQCCRHHDFYEGVRSVLIDKDHAPKWNPHHWQDVPLAVIDRHFSA